MTYSKKRTLSYGVILISVLLAYFCRQVRTENVFMRNLADQGVSIIMISSDLPEILRVSHRVIVMHDGKITLDGQTKDFDQEKIMHAAIS